MRILKPKEVKQPAQVALLVKGSIKTGTQTSWLPVKNFSHDITELERAEEQRSELKVITLGRFAWLGWPASSEQQC